MSHSKTKVKVVPYQDFTEIYLRSSFIKDVRIKIASGEKILDALDSAIAELMDKVEELQELKRGNHVQAG